MSTLVINDLPVGKDLDREAMANISGGHGYGRWGRRHYHRRWGCHGYGHGYGHGRYRDRDDDRYDRDDRDDDDD